MISGLTAFRLGPAVALSCRCCGSIVCPEHGVEQLIGDRLPVGREPPLPQQAQERRERRERGRGPEDSEEARKQRERERVRRSKEEGEKKRRRKKRRKKNKKKNFLKNTKKHEKQQSTDGRRWDVGFVCVCVF